MKEIIPKRRIVVHITTEVIVDEWPDESLTEESIMFDALDNIWEGTVVHKEIVGEI